MKQVLTILCASIVTVNVAMAQSPQPGQSPASKPRPKPVNGQTYPAEQVREGELRFVSQCGFCHGRDAAGGESGPDLTRSELVAGDTNGDRIGPLVRSGRADAGMPAFKMDDAETKAIAAFIHTQMEKFATLGGGRRAVDAEDLASGNAKDGLAYFNGAGGCWECHSAAKDLAGIATRFQGLALLQRMLYPSGRPAPSLPNAVFTLDSGEKVVAPLAAEDEFTVTVLDPKGARQTYLKSQVKVKIDDPMAAHLAQLARYTDTAMHDVYAYLLTLK